MAYPYKAINTPISHIWASSHPFHLTSQKFKKSPQKIKKCKNSKNSQIFKNNLFFKLKKKIIIIQECIISTRWLTRTFSDSHRSKHTYPTMKKGTNCNRPIKPRHHIYVEFLGYYRHFLENLQNFQLNTQYLYSEQWHNIYGCVVMVRQLFSPTVRWSDSSIVWHNRNYSTISIARKIK